MGADELIGTSWRSEALNQSGVHICDINGFLADTQGQLWIPVRSSAKARWLAGRLRYGCGRDGRYK